MQHFLFTFALFTLALAAMAIGVIFTGERGELKGSCGGVGANEDCCKVCPERDECDHVEEFAEAFKDLPASQKVAHRSLSQAPSTESGIPVGSTKT